MPDYPRICRNGHVIRGPEDEHGNTPGSHRQCWRCRRRTQTEADAKYNRSDRGQFIRSTYETSLRRYFLKRDRALLRQVDALERRAADLGIDARERSDRARERIRSEEVPPMTDVHRRRRLLEMIERVGGWDMYRVRLHSGL